MMLTPGQILNNRYRIDSLLGQGGFGAVYCAWDQTFEVACAIKENTETSPEAQRQFLREARMLHTLRHPNLPQVKDYFVLPDQYGASGAAYLVMDYIDGEDLEQMLRRRGAPLTEAEALLWIAQVCAALGYLHAQNPPVIHRDIKPANIRITPDGRAMLVDFGIAKTYDPTRSTTVGARAVTPGYSPLEQYGGRHTNACSDIYALGATLYALLTGSTPPEAPDRNLGEVLVPPSQINPSISPQIEGLILNALEILPQNRCLSAADFAAGLGVTPALFQPLSAPTVMQKPKVIGPGETQRFSTSARTTTPFERRQIGWIGGAVAAALALIWIIPRLIDSLPSPLATQPVETLPAGSIVTEATRPYPGATATWSAVNIPATSQPTLQPTPQPLASWQATGTAVAQQTLWAQNVQTSITPIWTSTPLPLTATPTPTPTFTPIPLTATIFTEPTERPGEEPPDKPKDDDPVDDGGGGGPPDPYP